MRGPKSRFGSTHYARCAKTFGSKSSRFEDWVSVLYAYDEVDSYAETPDQCAVKEKLNVRKTINSLSGQSEARKARECDKECCSRRSEPFSLLSESYVESFLESTRQQGWSRRLRPLTQYPIKVKSYTRPVIGSKDSTGFASANPNKLLVHLHGPLSFSVAEDVVKDIIRGM
jgi:hypothetical protein